MNCSISPSQQIDLLSAQQLELKNEISELVSRVKKIESVLPSCSEHMDLLTRDVTDLKMTIERQNSFAAVAKKACAEESSAVATPVDAKIVDAETGNARESNLIHTSNTEQQAATSTPIGKKSTDMSSWDISKAAKKKATNWSFTSTIFGTSGRLEHVYELEESLYGVIFVSPFWWPVVAVFFLFYVTALGIICVISINVVQTYEKKLTNLDNICGESEYGGYDCRPANYVNILDFEALDTNADGAWSQDEAKQSGMSHEFQALQNLVLETPKLLSIAAPPQKAAKNLFCFYTQDKKHSPAYSAYISHGLTSDEQIAFANATFQLSSAVMQECLSGSLNIDEDLLALLGPDADLLPDNSFDCLALKICERKVDNVWHLDSPARSSRDGYLLQTEYLTVFPRDIFEIARRSIELPCRLVEPQLCSNAEFEGSLSDVPQWEGFTPKNRIQACESFVETTCPEILGSDYERFQADTRTVCGDAKLSPESVVFKASAPGSQGTACVDNDALARETMTKVMEDNVFLQYVSRGFTNFIEWPALLDNVTCLSGSLLNWCHDVTEVIVDSANPSYRERVSSIFGRVCPETCCKAYALGCPGTCVAEVDLVNRSTGVTADTSASAFMKDVMMLAELLEDPPSLPDKQTHGNFDLVELSFGSLQCVGSFCSWLNIEGNMFGGLKIECPVLLAQASAKIILRKTKAVHITVSRFEGADALETSFFGDAPGCDGAYLDIDGVRYCAPSLPKGHQLYLPLKSGPVHEIVFVSEHTGQSYSDFQVAWSITITGAGEPGEFSIITAQFAEAQKTETFTDWNYKVFISLIYFLWTSFVLVEADKAYDMAEVILGCPIFQSRQIYRRSMLFVCFLRFLVSLWMFAVGCILLAAVPDYIDVVLNSVALGFIFEFDDALYSIAVPTYVKRKIYTAEPYRWGSFKPKGYKVAIGTCIPALVALGAVVFQYTWRHGSSQINEQMSCACHVEGAECVGAVFNVWSYR